MSLEMLTPEAPPKASPSRSKSYSPWLLSSRRNSSSRLKVATTSFSPTKHVSAGNGSAAAHAPRRPPPPLRPSRSNSVSGLTVVVPSEDGSKRPSRSVGQKKRRATLLDTPQTRAMCLAFESVSLDTPQISPTHVEPSVAATSLDLRDVLSPSTSSASTRRSALPQIQTSRLEAIVQGEPRVRLSPASTASTISNPALLPPSPVPSFPPFTPKEDSQNDTVAIGTTASDEPSPSAVTSVRNPVDHTNPAYFIVPSTCDKRRLDPSSEPEPVDPTTATDSVARPTKKLKRANGHGRAVTRLSTSSLPELIMPTAIDVVDFIDRMGGTCYEGDVFLRFRTGESEHVRSVVNDIILLFAQVDVGKDGSRWVTLCPGISSRRPQPR